VNDGPSVGGDLRLWGRTGHPDANRCPRDGQELSARALVDLAYVFDTCDCAAVGYLHLIEQLWHRGCLAAEFGQQAVDALAERERLQADAKREALAAAHKTLAREAVGGVGAAPPRQRIDYPGGLRRAAKIVDRMLGDTMEQLRRLGPP